MWLSIAYVYIYVCAYALGGSVTHTTWIRTSSADEDACDSGAAGKDGDAAKFSQLLPWPISVCNARTFLLLRPLQGIVSTNIMVCLCLI